MLLKKIYLCSIEFSHQLDLVIHLTIRPSYSTIRFLHYYCSYCLYRYAYFFFAVAAVAVNVIVVR